MAIVHIVLFEWKPTATQEQIEIACKRMLAFGETCLHPTTKKPYLKSCRGGKNTSPEPYAAGFTHGFIVEIESEEDRGYYLNKDPEHLAFGKVVGELLKDVKVLDFESGKI